MKKMAATFMNYLLGTFATRIVQFLFLPVYTSYIIASDLGRYDTIHAYIQVLLPLLYQAVWDAILRIGFDQKSDQDKKSFYSTVIPYTMLLSVAYILLGVILSAFGVQYAILIALMVASSGLLTIWQNASRALGNTRAYAVSNVVSASTSIAVNVILVVSFSLGVRALMLANITAGIVTIVVVEFMIKLRRHISPKLFSRQIFKEVLHYTRHFMVGTTAWKLLGLCSPLVIPMLLGYAANGIYSIALRFQTVLSTITFVYNMAWQEELIRRAGDEDRQTIFNNTYQLLLRLCFGALFVILPATYFLYPYLVKGEYMESLSYIPFIFLECIITTLVSHISSAFIMEKATFENMLDTVSGAAVSILLMVLLGSQFGLYGIAAATLLGSFWRLFLCRKLISLYLVPNLRLPQLLLYIAVYAMLSFILIMTGTMAQMILFVCMTALALMMNRKLMLQILNSVKTKFGV